MVFEDRYEAGDLLAEKLSKLKLPPNKAILAAIPRGGVVVASAISQKLKIPIVPVVVKKIPAPHNRELAIGATASFGKPTLDEFAISDLGVSGEYIRRQTHNKKKEARAREKFLGVNIDFKVFEGKNVIVIDDGLATGMSSKAAAKMLRSFEPARLVLAVPCASLFAIEVVEESFDEVVCLEATSDFMAVGQFYKNFEAVSDSEVREALKENKIDN